MPVVFPIIRDAFNEHRKEGSKALTISDIKDWVQEEGYWGYKQVGKKTIGKRSSDATTIEMMEGIEKLQKYFGSIGYDIPSPDEKDYRMGKEYKPPDTKHPEEDYTKGE